MSNERGASDLRGLVANLRRLGVPLTCDKHDYQCECHRQFNETFDELEAALAQGGEGPVGSKPPESDAERWRMAEEIDKMPRYQRLQVIVNALAAMPAPVPARVTAEQMREFIYGHFTPHEHDWANVAKRFNVLLAGTPAPVPAEQPQLTREQVGKVLLHYECGNLSIGGATNELNALLTGRSEASARNEERVTGE